MDDDIRQRYERLQLAESLAQTGFFERLSPGVYALAPQAHAHLEHEPAYLVNEAHQSNRLNELGAQPRVDCAENWAREKLGK